MSLTVDVRWHPHGRGSVSSSVGEHEFRPGEPARFELKVSCTLEAPVTGVFGPSGSGKTTLLSLVAGLQHPAEGRISLDSTTLFDARAGIDVPTHRRSIGIVFQDGRLFPHLSVHGNLQYGIRRSVNAKLSLHSVVDMLALAPLLDRRVQHLSGGERQRVALGRALLSAPRLLLLDEPLASLDVAMKRQVLPMLREAMRSSGTPMVYVSHDIGEILQLTPELLVMDGGRSIGQGPLHTVVRDAEVFRLAARTGLENVLRARIEERLPESGLTRLRLITPEGAKPGAVLLGPPVDRPVGSELTIAIRPEDIALSLGVVEGISIQNQVPATVTRATQVAGRGLLEVDVGDCLLVEVSLRSMATLQLAPGKAVYCLFKAHAVRYLDA